VADDAHFYYILHYIHANPLDFLPGAAGWRYAGVKSGEEAETFLTHYPWSSYHAYVKEGVVDEVTHTAFFKSVFPDYAQYFTKFLKGLQGSPDAPPAKMLLEK